MVLSAECSGQPSEDRAATLVCVRLSPEKGYKRHDHREAMLRVIRACASLLLLEDEHCQGWRPVLCAGLPGGFHSGGLSFSVTAPLLFSLHSVSPSSPTG